MQFLLHPRTAVATDDAPNQDRNVRRQILGTKTAEFDNLLTQMTFWMCDGLKVCHHSGNIPKQAAYASATATPHVREASQPPRVLPLCR